MRKTLFFVLACIALAFCMNALADSDINLAQNKTITTTSEWWNLPVTNAVDGNTDTYWESMGYPAEVTVDLQEVFSVCSMRIRLNPDPIWDTRTQSIEVRVSSDGSKYTKAVEKKQYRYSPSSGNLVDISLGTVDARYVKLVFTDGSWKNGAQAAEIMVFGTIEETIDETTGIPSDAKEYNGHAYKAYNQTLSWEEARKECESRGGHLVTITSSDEQKMLEKLIRNKGEFWIGMRRVNDSSFAWITGEEAGYSKWGSGEPNNYWKPEFPGENVVAMRPDWNDYHENNLENIAGYICEWEMGQKPEENRSTDNGTTQLVWGTKSLSEAEIAGEALALMLGEPMVLNTGSLNSYDVVNSRFVYIKDKQLLAVIRTTENQLYVWEYELSPMNLMKASLIFDENAPVCCVSLTEGSQMINYAIYQKSRKTVYSFDKFKQELENVKEKLSSGNLSGKSGNADPILSCFPGLSWGMTVNEAMTILDSDSFKVLEAEGRPGLSGSIEVYGKSVMVMIGTSSKGKLNTIIAFIDEEDSKQMYDELMKAYGKPYRTTFMKAMSVLTGEIEEDPEGECYVWMTDKTKIIMDNDTIQYWSLYN